MKKVVLGLIVGLCIGATGTVIASSDFVQARFAAFNIVVDGDVKELDVAPLVLEGTSYLPVREMSILLGYDVSYVMDTRTIELNSTMSEGDITKLEKNDALLTVIQQFWRDAKDEEIATIGAIQNRINTLKIALEAIHIGLQLELSKAPRADLQQQKVSIEAEVERLEQKITDLEYEEFRKVINEYDQKIRSAEMLLKHNRNILMHTDSNIVSQDYIRGIQDAMANSEAEIKELEAQKEEYIANSNVRFSSSPRIIVPIR